MENYLNIETAAISDATPAPKIYTMNVNNSAYPLLFLYCLEDLWSSPIYDEIMASDISTDWNYLHIKRAVTYPNKSIPVINEPKTKRSNRFVNLIDWVANILKAQQKESGFILGGDKPLCYVSRSRLQRNAWKHVGLEGKNICPYDFRANFATMLCECGKSDKQVADMMGHADTRMVDTVYAPARKEGILQNKEACEALFGL